jgi:hypothetical protein
MAPASRTVLRQFAAFVAGMGQATITYQLHAFSGRTYSILWALDLALTFAFIQLLIAEGRERADRERQG